MRVIVKDQGERAADPKLTGGTQERGMPLASLAACAAPRFSEALGAAL